MMTKVPGSDDTLVLATRTLVVITSGTLKNDPIFNAHLSEIVTLLQILRSLRVFRGSNIQPIQMN